eukprot:768397-Hanusia_phi.AAC.9
MSSGRDELERYLHESPAAAREEEDQEEEEADKRCPHLRKRPSALVRQWRKGFKANRGGGQRYRQRSSCNGQSMVEQDKLMYDLCAASLSQQPGAFLLCVHRSELKAE